MRFPKSPQKIFKTSVALVQLALLLQFSLLPGLPPAAFAQGATGPVTTSAPQKPQAPSNQAALLANITSGAGAPGYSLGLATTPKPSLPAPNVPTETNLITPSVAANLAGVLKAAQQVINVGNLQNGTYSISGNFVNTKNLILVSTNPNIRTATISVTGSLFNPVGTSISTLIPTGYNNAVSNLNLSLVAQSGIYNAGSIISAGSLSMNAPVIANVQPSTIGATGPAAVMQAMTGNVSMQTSTILNQGTISAVMGNIAVANLTNNLAINALGGTFSAANGTIDIGTKTLTDKLNLQIMGGDFISKTLNLQAGTCGQVSMQSNSVAGVLNVNSAGDASISTDSLLNIGNFQVGGDPYIQSNDDIYISASDAFGLGTLMVDSGGSIFCQGGIARADEYINGSLNPGSVYLWAEKDINLGGNVQASGNVTMIARNGSINAPNTSMLVGGIMFLTAAGGSLTVDSITSTAVGKYDPGVPGMFSYSVSAFAHNDLNVNSVNALNSVMIRGSGNYSNGICYAGFNPGSVTVGKVNVKNAASYAEIYIDDWGGPIKTGSIQMAGTSSPGGRAISISGPNISVGSITNNSSGTLRTDIYINGDFTESSVMSIGTITTSGPTSDVVSIDGYKVSIDTISNTSTGPRGGIVEVSGANLSIGKIINNCSGFGGYIFLSGNSTAPLLVPNTIMHAGTGGGEISISNYGPLNYVGGIEASSTTTGTSIFLSSRSYKDGLLTVSKNIDLSAAGSSSGGRIVLQGGSGVIVNNELNVSATGTGSAGGIYITGDHSNVIVNRNLSANSAQQAGGRIELNASGFSTVQVNPGVKIAANGGAGGGTVTVNTEDGITVNGTSITANGTGANANGGTISITDGVIGPGPTGGPVTVNCNLIADAGQNGTGGNITVSTHGAGNVVTIGQSGSATLRARGGTTSGDGGSVSISSDADLSVNSKTWKVDPYTSGNGGSVSLVSSHGNLITTGNIEVNGAGSGNGGSITLKSGGGDLTIGNGDTKLFADSGTNGGNGGSISITAGGLLTVAKDAVIDTSVRGKNGNGGNVSLTGGGLGAKGGGVAVYNEISTTGMGNGNGGTITVTAANDLTSGGTAPVVIDANLVADAGKAGTGGMINITATGAGNKVTIGSERNRIKLSAMGGTKSGNGGTINVSSDDAINVNNVYMTVGAGGLGNGGIINITAGKAGSGDLNFTGTMVADGEGNGSTGGTVNIAAAGDLTTGTGEINVNARGGNGNGGNVTITAGSLGGVGSVAIGSNINADASGNGNGGNISITMNSAKEFDITSKITADAPGSGNSGEITITNNTQQASTIRISGQVDAFSTSGRSGSLNLNEKGDFELDLDNPKYSSENGPLKLSDPTGNITIIAAETQHQLEIETIKGGGVVGIALGRNSSITVDGKIEAKDTISLDAGSITNSGTITSESGGVTLCYTGTGYTKDGFLVNQGCKISNTGTIQATGAHGAIVVSCSGGIEILGSGKMISNSVSVTTGGVQSAAIEFSGNQDFLLYSANQISLAAYIVQLDSGATVSATMPKVISGANAPGVGLALNCAYLKNDGVLIDNSGIALNIGSLGRVSGTEGGLGGKTYRDIEVTGSGTIKSNNLNVIASVTTYIGGVKASFDGSVSIKQAKLTTTGSVVTSGTKVTIDVSSGDLLVGKTTSKAGAAEIKNAGGNIKVVPNAEIMSAAGLELIAQKGQITIGDGAGLQGKRIQIVAGMPAATKSNQATPKTLPAESLLYVTEMKKLYLGKGVTFLGNGNFAFLAGGDLVFSGITKQSIQIGSGVSFKTVSFVEQPQINLPAAHLSGEEKIQVFTSEGTRGVWCDASSINLTGGKILLAPPIPFVVSIDGLTVKIGPGAIVLISKTDKGTLVAVLTDQKAGQVTLLNQNRTTILNAGSMAFLSKNKYPEIDLPVRNWQSAKVGSATMISAELSIPALISKDLFVKQTLQRNFRLQDQVLKFSAAMLTVTPAKGPYRPYAPSEFSQYLPPQI